jgi:Plasmid pRiA4b ORF-3-like protein
MLWRWLSDFWLEDPGSSMISEHLAKLKPILAAGTQRHRLLFSFLCADPLEWLLWWLSRRTPSKKKNTTWRHEVLFEGFPPVDPKAKCPLCVEGARACPPEDCGGPWGFVGNLAAIADPKHEQHKEMLKWRRPFVSEAFDAKKAAREMRRVK